VKHACKIWESRSYSKLQEMCVYIRVCVCVCVCVFILNKSWFVHRDDIVLYKTKLGPLGPMTALDTFFNIVHFLQAND
jgi:hypothetical protein